MSSEPPVIALSDVSKRYELYDKPQHRFLQGLFRGRRQFYREFWALRDVSFEIGRGETVGIIGRNGAGKSTLLQLVCGTLTPTAGTLSVRGRLAALLELGSGFNPEFTGRENVVMYASVLGLGASEIDRKFDAIAAFADIGQFLDQPLKTYSSGMAVRLAFAVVANVDADILVIDEALAVGDAFFVQKCMRFLRRFRDSGTLLFVSHDTGAVLSICDRAIWLQQGRVAGVGGAKPTVEAYLQAAAEATAAAAIVAPPPPPMPVPEPATEATGGPAPANAEDAAEPALGTFDPSARSFGLRGASIVDARLCDREGRVLGMVRGGEPVELVVRARTHAHMERVLLGFVVKDRLGQSLFGETTDSCAADAALDVAPERAIEGRFAFAMPLLPPGDYTVCVAVAEGHVTAHVQHHYFADALAFRCETDAVRFGLVGVPMERVRVAVTAPEEAAA